MAPTSHASTKKRKQSIQEEEDDELLVEQGNLDLDSDAENSGAESDDGEVDEFPELDVASDSELDSDFEEDLEEDDEDEEESDLDSDSTLNDDPDAVPVGPKAKTVTSDITGQPKRVYPEIEPDYDSDSSTEDVSSSITSLLLYSNRGF
jgi:ribosome biogenesis protein ERB1